MLPRVGQGGGGGRLCSRQRHGVVLVAILASLIGAASKEGDQEGSSPASIIASLANRHDANSPDDLSHLYVSGSKELGVTHCTLQGVLRPKLRGPRQCRAFAAFPVVITPKGVSNVTYLCDNDTLVNLHLFMRLSVQNGTAYLRGFAKLERVGRFDLEDRFMAGSVNDYMWTHNVWLGAARTRTKYGPIQVNRNTTSRSAVKHFLWQPIKLKREDAEFPEFEVFSEGFGYSCYLLPAQRSSLVDMMSKASVKVIETRSGPQRAPYNIFLISPLLQKDPARIAHMLHWSILWHAHYGIDIYVMYVQFGLQAFLEQQVVQELVKAGRLVVVHWDAMAGLLGPIFTGEERGICLETLRYYHQFMVYNHFQVAMWLQNVVVFEADLDEWIMTPKPMTLQQIMTECGGKADRPVSDIQLLRRVGYCTACNSTELQLWLNSAKTGPAEDHPLQKYSVSLDHDSEAPRSIMRPDYMLSVDPYVGVPLDGSTSYSLKETDCAYVLHMAWMLKEREYHGRSDSEGEPLTEKHLWPLHQQLARYTYRVAAEGRRRQRQRRRRGAARRSMLAAGELAAPGGESRSSGGQAVGEDAPLVGQATPCANGDGSALRSR